MYVMRHKVCEGHIMTILATRRHWWWIKWVNRLIIRLTGEQQYAVFDQKFLDRWHIRGRKRGT